MAIKVLSVDLNAPLPALDFFDSGDCSYVQLLVRKGDRTIGYARINPRSADLRSEAALRQEIQRQLRDELVRDAFKSILGDNRAAEPATLPYVTVAICTRGRPESLHTTLQSLECLDYPSGALDVLVVDNAPSDDETRRVVAEFARTRYVVEPCPGLDWARNRAIAEARGEILAFTDDDAAVDPGWLRAVAPHFAHPSVMCVTGLVAPAERQTAAQNLFEEYGGFGRGFERRYYTPGMQRVMRYYPLRPGTFGTGCNMAFRKTVFDRIGAFDEALDVGTPAGGGGDLEMFYRVLSAGHVLVYEPDAIVWHYHRRDMAALHRQIRGWGSATYAVWTKICFTAPADRWRVVGAAAEWTIRHYLMLLLRSRRPIRSLVATEALGALEGPLRYFQARRRAATIARAYNSALSTPERGDRPPLQAAALPRGARRV